MTLSALDAAFLEPEHTDLGATNIGGTMVFDRPPGGPPTLQDLHAALSARIGGLRRYTQRLSSLRASHFFWPRWEPDPEVEIGQHIRRATLPGPGRERQLCEWTAEFFSGSFDRTRPAWELVLLEGLEHGRWALAHKANLCPADGVGSVDVLGLLLDDQPDARHDRLRLTPRSWSDTSGGVVGSHAPGALMQTAQAAVPTADVTVHAAFHPSNALDPSRALLDFLARDERHTSVNGPSGLPRSYAVVRTPLAELEAIGQVLGGSFDDVMLAACAGGLRRLLLDRGEPLGQAIGSRFVELPVHEPAAAARVARIAARTRRLKAGRAGRGPLGAAIGRTTVSTRLFDVTITNLPGSPEPLHAFGAPLREVLPVLPLAAQDAVGIAIFPYDGTVTVGLSAEEQSVPDLDVVVMGIEESLEELREYGA